MKCPFCGEDDFDLIGLKGHLLQSCEKFDLTLTPMQDMARRRKAHERDKPSAHEVGDEGERNG